MSSVKFKAFQCNDDRQLVSREEAMAFTLAFAGNHTMTPENLIEWEEALGNWEDDEGTWQVDGSDRLEGTGDDDAQWYKYRHVTEVEGSFIATFTKTGNVGAFVIMSNDSYSAYLVWWTATTVGASTIADTVETVLFSRPLAETGTANVKVGAYLQSHSKIDEIDDITLALWFDDKLLFAYSTEYEEKGNKVGFGVQSGTSTFDDLRIGHAHAIREWTSVDPGESAAASMSRTLAHSRIRPLARYNGDIALLKVRDKTADWSITDNRLDAHRLDHVVYWPTHLRLVGALHEADSLRTGDHHTFALDSDPDALTEGETKTKGEAHHKELHENADGGMLALPPNPVIEPLDVVTVDGVDYRVVSIDYRITWKGGIDQGSPVWSSTMNIRRSRDT